MFSDRAVVLHYTLHEAASPGVSAEMNFAKLYISRALD